MSSRKAKLGDFLIRSKIPIDIEDNTEYKRVTIRTKHQGVYVRDFEIGSKIGTKKQFILKAGQFVLSKIDAMYGAFGIAPDEVEGAIITGNFWAYDYNKNMVSIEWLNHFTNSPEFYDLCRRASTGITHRKYLDEDFFLSYEVNLPDIDEQNNLVVSIDNIRDKIGSLENELNYQLTQLENLNQAILQEAVQGKLVKQDPKDEPASELLQRIKWNRVGFQPDPNEHNIGLKPTKSAMNRTGFKPRPMKELPPIKPGDIPFEIPDNWVWCRFNEIYDVRDGTHDSPKYHKDGYPFITSKNLVNGELDFFNVKYISLEDHIEFSKRSKVEIDDILFAMIGTIGNPVIVSSIEKEFSIKNVALFKNFAKELIDTKYIFWLLSFSTNELKNQSRGGIQKFVSLQILRSLPIPLPPLSEQKRIVAEIEKQLAKTKQLKEHILANQIATEQLLKALLHQAFEVNEKEKDLTKA